MRLGKRSPHSNASQAARSCRPPPRVVLKAHVVFVIFGIQNCHAVSTPSMVIARCRLRQDGQFRRSADIASNTDIIEQIPSKPIRIDGR